MAKQGIDIGIEGNDGTGDSIRESFRKVNENFQELYAVFGIGGQISYTDLSDTPNTYEGNENKLPSVRGNGSGIDFLQLASDNALTSTTDTIGFDYSIEGKLIIRQLVSKVSNDPNPTLSGPLNASAQPIANVATDQAALEQFNSTYNTNYDLGSLVIDKNYGDRNYQTKEVSGGGIRLSDEPTNATGYTFTASGILQQNLTFATAHGLSEAYNGAPFVFKSTGTNPFGIPASGVVHVRIVDTTTIRLFETEADAIANASSNIALSGGSGTFTITDAAYDSELEGFWLDNVAIPRKSAVRRQGDSMTGVLNLSDHPGELSGFGLPNSSDDLQAATKLYVDNLAASSEVNLYVAQNGDDRQTNTPRGREGRNPAYAYRTINAAARKAEEVIITAPYEPGPYMQTMTYNTGENFPGITTAGATPSESIGGLLRTNARSRIIKNKEFIQKEVTSYINTTFPDFVGSYNEETCERDIGYILEAVTLDAVLGNNANYLSRWSGFRYYSNPSAQKAIGSQKIETVAGIQYARTIVQNIIAGTAVATTYQTRVPQLFEVEVAGVQVNQPDAAADTAIDGKFTLILDIIDDGPLQAPTIVDGGSVYQININNGNFGFIDQADPANTDIIPGKVVRGKDSGAVARIIEYKTGSSGRSPAAEIDQVDVQLLEPINFLPGEQLEYGNVVRETQCTLLVESGIYYEDYPIRVPPNVTILGDEFRRCLIRPKDRISQSAYAGTFFYRDREFDGLVLGRSEIGTLSSTTPANDLRTAGTYTLTDQDYATTLLGEDAIFSIVVDDIGAVTSITPTNKGKNFQVGELITIPDAQLSGGGAPDLIIKIDSIPNGVEYINPSTGKVDGYFGYHYLRDPSRLKDIGAGYTNIGKWETAALALIDNKEFIQEQVVEYINVNYPAMVGAYSEVKSKRDTGYIVDALVKDLRAGGNEFSLQTQGEYYAGSLGDINQTGCIAGMDYVYTLATSLLTGVTPPVLGDGLDFPTADLFNGSAEPADWVSGKLYRVGNVIKAIDASETVYYQSKKESISGAALNAQEVTDYWTLVKGPQETVELLVGSITFAFNANYNPPLRNDQMDVFLMNDATRVSNVTVQGHGGFMCTLDPEGQVLTKSPYIQVGSSFSRSQNKQVFSGGMFIDAFNGNSAVQVIEKVDASNFRLKVKSLPNQGLFIRKPQTPSAFYIDGRRFQINAISQYDPDFGTAELILDRNSNDGDGFTGTTSSLITGINLDTVGTFEFNEDKCDRDTRYILEGIGYDVAFGTNYNSVTNGLAYRRSYANEVIDNQLTQTTTAIGVAKTETAALSEVADSAAALSDSNAGFDEVIDIITNGVANADAISYSDPGVDSNKRFAREQLQTNRTFIGTAIDTWLTTTYPAYNLAAGYVQADFLTEINYIVDALSYDMQYGGNTAIKTGTRFYFDDGISILSTAQKPIYSAMLVQLKVIVEQIVVETYAGQDTSGTAATGAETTQIATLMDAIIGAVSSDTLQALPATIYPATAWAPTDRVDAKNQIDANTALIAHRTVQSVNAPLGVTLQTAGNRSMLGNDFTQVNDLGYGLICVNGALSEMVSMFTYYCWASYYAKNGSEIRSVTGSSCYGEYGLVAEGSDPNEIPDTIVLAQDMTLPGKTFDADLVLTLTGNIETTAGTNVTQLVSGATGIVRVDTAQVADGSASGSRYLYLTTVNGAFDTTNEIQVTAGASFGATSVPISVDTRGYGNPVEQLSIHVYDMKDAPSNRSEFDIFHPLKPSFARYEAANVEIMPHHVGEYPLVNTTIAATVAAAGTPTGAIFSLYKTVTYGYTASITNVGSGNTIGDTYTVLGSALGGTDVTHNAVITISAINAAGGITAVTVAGNPFVEATTPKYSGVVYKLNFSTSDVRYSTNGLLEAVGWGVFINYRRNQTHILNDIARPDVLTIRPSTAVIFNENPNTVYRSISFLTSDSIGTVLGDNVAQAGFDETYDYIRLLIDQTNAQLTTHAGVGGTTMGNTAGDDVIAVQATVDANEISRLNNNSKTPELNRPLGWAPTTLQPAPIISWGGKKHYVHNYRGVDAGGVIVAPAEDNSYGIVDITEVGDDLNVVAQAGLASPVILGNETVTLRAGLRAGAIGNVTVNISTCRATAHDFLDVGTGGFNQSNYPNVIFGLPRESDQAKEVEERTKGRVFYVSTDQNGIFRVGRFFSVDQGTGTVTFSASLALSDVDGLGFKRGVVITEFSTDTAMTDNASDTVPTESAVRGYVNRRLGYDVNGTPVANKIGPGVLAPNGAVPMTDDLNAAGNTITNLSAPTSGSDAATKTYADSAQANNDTIPDFRDTEINGIDYKAVGTPAIGQPLITTGYKKIFLNADTIVSGPFERGDEITGTVSGATGTIVDATAIIGYEGNLTVIVYTETSVIDFNTSDVVTTVGGTQGNVLDGPVAEWANAVEGTASEITMTTDRIVTLSGGEVTSRYTAADLIIKTNSIDNSKIKADANIVQSKLLLNAASTRVDAASITQGDLGVASFDDARFTSANGWISIKAGSVPLVDLEDIATDSVLGRSIAGAGEVTGIPFATVVGEGGGLLDSDFAAIIIPASDSGEALIKTGAGTYGITNVTKTGEVNSIVKTDASGSIIVSSLILGASGYEILSLSGAGSTTLNIKTPAQGTVLTAVGNGTGNPSGNVTAEFSGSVNIGGTGIAEGLAQIANVQLTSQPVLAVDWVYTNFIEAAGERSNATTGIGIGGGTEASGVISIVTGDINTGLSAKPFIFSKTGVVPDEDNVYDIGSATKKYKDVYATLFRGTATESYYADLAENYLGDEQYEPGTVVVFGGAAEITITSTKGDHRVAGVVSTNPAHLMNSHCEGENIVAVALQGRVPCKVLGKVAKGDILVSASIAGYAIVNNNPGVGTVIGKALEDKLDGERGLVEVVVGKH